mmetsp:Transcript_87003/g.106701  ORF Transcript_87003/g.106701 Transcript_87003/m.106701 type:complete len:231 (-) Transcript_87003:125-817(-)
MAGKGYAAPQPNETLFVTGLPMNCTNEQAKGVFGQYGNVKSVTVMPVAAGKTAAAAFVIMETVDQAKWIVDNLNGNIPGHLTAPVTVVFATPKNGYAPIDTIFVAGLPATYNSEQATRAFAQYGNVKQVTMMPVAPGKTTAAAFIKMETADQAKWIVENLNGNIPGGLTAPVKVVLATPRDQWKGKGKGFGKMMGKGGGKDMMAGMMSMMSMMGMMMESMGKGGGRYGPY